MSSIAEYCPQIDGVLDAFDIKNGYIEIPYKENLAIGKENYNGFIIKVKNAFSDTLVGTCFSVGPSCKFYFSDFNFSNHFIPGKFYKVQIAYTFNDEIGLYSNIGVIKCSKSGVGIIENLSEYSSNSIENLFNLKVRYECDSEDTAEKLLSYNIQVLNKDFSVEYQTEDTLYSSYEEGNTIFCPIEFSENDEFYVRAIFKTLNRLEVISPVYKIIIDDFQVGEFLDGVSLKATLNYDNAYIALKFNCNGKIPFVGNFYIIREETDGINMSSKKQIILGIMPFNGVIENNKIIFKDFCIQQGKKYRYGIKIQYPNGSFSLTQMISGEAIYCDFEDMFLFDGEKQLKLRYNPKMTNKINILDSKVDTIGGKYPVIMRNGNSNYKEFSVSTLLSYLEDEEKLFMNFEEFQTENTSFCQTYETTQLTPQNFRNERIFKEKVISWLNNGQTKLFKTPDEGNYLVRPMSVSVTPTDSLSRLLSTLSFSLIQVQDYTLQNLFSLGFLKYVMQTNKKGYVSKRLNRNNYITQFSTPIQFFTIDSKPGNKFLIKTETGNKIIMIGKTGNYNMQYNTENVYSIEPIVNNENFYEYEDSVINYLDNVFINNITQTKTIEKKSVISRTIDTSDLEKVKVFFNDLENIQETNQDAGINSKIVIKNVQFDFIPTQSPDYLYLQTSVFSESGLQRVIDAAEYGITDGGSKYLIGNSAFKIELPKNLFINVSYEYYKVKEER